MHIPYFQVKASSPCLCHLKAEECKCSFGVSGYDLSMSQHGRVNPISDGLQAAVCLLAAASSDVVRDISEGVFPVLLRHWIT